MTTEIISTNSVTETFTSDLAVWTVPINVSTIYVRGWGGGGGFAKSTVFGRVNAASGGGSAYAWKQIAVTAGSQFKIVIGTAGDFFTDGGQTKFIPLPGTTPILQADGGKHGETSPTSAVAGAGGLAANCIGDLVASGAPGQSTFKSFTSRVNVKGGGAAGENVAGALVALGPSHSSTGGGAVPTKGGGSGQAPGGGFALLNTGGTAGGVGKLLISYNFAQPTRFTKFRVTLC